MIQLARLVKHIEQLATIGATSTGGVSRLSYTLEERAANDFVRQLMLDAGMTASYDSIGNMIGTYTYGATESEPLIIGSHIDTVPNGGKYDGALGVLTAIEVVQTMHELGMTYPRPIHVIAFKDEEGSRFGVGMLGSSAVVGTFDESLLNVQDADGISLAEAMQRQGFDPAAISTAHIERIHAYLELHIEQGRVLEAAQLPVGIVTGIAGPIWFEATITGLHEHAGATPMPLRQDALVGAAEMMLAIEQIAQRYENGVATVGKLAIQNAGINVIPGQVTFICDLRHIDLVQRDAMEQDILHAIHAIAQKRQLTLQVADLQRIAPAPTDRTMRAAIERAIEAVDVTPFSLPSGAGHDAMLFADHCPIGMIFIRTKDGISHNPIEYAAPDDIEIGANVLLQSILQLATLPKECHMLE